MSSTGKRVIKRFEDIERADKVSLSKENKVISLITKKRKKADATFADSLSDDFIEDNMRLISHIVKKYMNDSCEYDEAFSCGLVGYSKAIATYNCDKGTKFSTYAYRCIRNEILNFYRESNKSKTKSMDETIFKDEKGKNFCLLDLTPDIKKNVNPEEMIILKEELGLFSKVFEKLTNKEKYILIYRYGLKDGIIKKQSEIAKDLNMSQANVSKSEKAILKKCKRLMEKGKINIKNTVI